MVDVNQRLDVLGNIRQAQLLEDLDLVWYEEPALADDLAACAEVAHAIRIPVATGENNYTRFEFRELIERRAARYLMPDVCRANGFTETLRIGQLAAAQHQRREGEGIAGDDPLQLREADPQVLLDILLHAHDADAVQIRQQRQAARKTQDAKADMGRRGSSGIAGELTHSRRLY